MCTGMEIAALVGAGTSLISALGGGKGKKVEPEPLMIPGMSEEDYKRIMGKAENLATQQYVAPINDLMKFAYSIPLQYYGGFSPHNITIPGITNLAGTPGGGSSGGQNAWMPGNLSPGLAGGMIGGWSPGGMVNSWAAGLRQPGGQPIGRGTPPWMQQGGGKKSSMAPRQMPKA